MRFLSEYKKYYFYAGAIIIGRGLEYFVLLFAAFYLSKEDYGQLEFYKRVIELVAVGVAFGLPSLLLTYTKSNDSKVYLSTLSIGFIIFLGITLAPILWFIDYQFLLIPTIFHAIFFNNGVMPVFCLTFFGSNIASYYKSIISVFFYFGVFLLIIFSPSPEKAFVDINYFMLTLTIIYPLILYQKTPFEFNKIKRYFNLFTNLLASSLTLVLSNFANMMFLYTDIMILKLISSSANSDIADYCFSLNIANMLIIIPFTMVQVDIEGIKKSIALKKKAFRIFKLCLTFCLLLSLFYILLVNTLYLDFSQTVIVFMIILFAKFFQAQSVLHGALLLVQKQFRINLMINLMVLFLNIGLSYIFYFLLGIIGIALASLLSLSIRFLLLKNFSNLKNHG